MEKGGERKESTERHAVYENRKEMGEGGGEGQRG